jgi:opacity protein-like surface antigen
MGFNHWAIGGSIHYMGFKDEGYATTTHYSSWPISFYGKYLIGENKLQGYLKGVTGAQFFAAKRETLTGEKLKDTDFSFTIGTGVGSNYKLNEKIFLNLDYELLYLTHAFYDKALTHAVTLGIGIKIQ